MQIGRDDRIVLLCRILVSVTLDHLGRGLRSIRFRSDAYQRFDNGFMFGTATGNTGAVLMRAAESGHPCLGCTSTCGDNIATYAINDLFPVSRTPILRR